MSRYLIGQQLSVSFFTYDAAGNLQNADATPTLTVNYPGGVETLTPTNPTTGRYTVTHEATVKGRHVFELEGLIDAIPEYGVQYVTVHDGQAEAEGGPFPYGKASWESAVS